MYDTRTPWGQDLCNHGRVGVIERLKLDIDHREENWEGK